MAKNIYSHRLKLGLESKVIRKYSIHMYMTVARPSGRYQGTNIQKIALQENQAISSSAKLINCEIIAILFPIASLSPF